MTRGLSSILIGLLLVAVSGSVTAADVVGPKLQAVLTALGPTGEVDVIITLSHQLDPAAFHDRDKRLRRSRLNKALRSHASRTQGPLIALLQGLNARNVTPLWIVNGIAARVPAAAIPRLARLPGVASVKLDETLTAPAPQLAPAATPEWNLSAIRAPELWTLGHTGTGVVVASMDTGVDVDHPDLASRWRGGSNSWFDPHLESAAPHDPHGHGTQVMGVLVGGEAGGTAIGVAPGARWIAVKLFDNSGTTSLSKIHAGFQWLLNPDGNPDVDDAPDIVNNSWHLAGTQNVCNGEFAPDLAALKAAGIAVVFAAGNTGPGSATSVSPSNDPGAVAVGAVDEWLIPGNFSGRGPSACDGGIYPGIVAPGVSVRTADLTFGGLFPDSYVSLTGTSFATPHLSGGLALLLSALASRGVPVTVSQLESAVAASAVDLAGPGPDNDSGFGLLDVVAAYEWLVANAGGLQAGADSYSVPQGGTLSVPAPGVLANDSSYDTSGASLVSAPTRASSFTLNPGGSFSYTHDGSATTSDSFVYQVTDGAVTVPATVTIAVIQPPTPPVANAGTATTNEDTPVALTLTASDANGDPLTYAVVTGPANGTLSGTPPTLTYTPAANFNGADSLTFIANDGGATSNVATVSITVIPVNDAPSFTAGASQTVTPPAGAQTVPSWATAISAGPANEAGQTVSFLVSTTNPALFSVPPAVSATGTLTYTPAPGASGVATLTVQIQDNGGTATGGVNTGAAQSRTITVNAAPAGDLIFQDSFESGNFSAWSGRQDTEADLSVTAGAALVGGFGMAALIDNNTAMWVRDDTPNNETRYRARFYFDPNGILMVHGNTFRIMAARSGNVNAGTDVLRVEFRRANNLYQVRAAIASDAGEFTNTAWYTVPDAPTPIEIEWQAATAAGANNGSLTLWTAGGFRQTRSGIDNDALRINSVRLGPLQGIDTETRGTVYFDGFVSRRATYIGP